jgi:hypothetical protein
VAQPTVQRCLASRVLTQSGRQDVAEDAFLDDGRIDAAARNRLSYGNGAKLGCLERFQSAKKFSGGESGGPNDDGMTHVTSPEGA